MKLAFFALLPVAINAFAQPVPNEMQLPEWAGSRWEKVAKERSLKLSTRINPFLLRGDFDGDGKADLALLVEHTPSKKVGILILPRGSSEAHVLGAGKQFENGGDDFTWLDIWNVQDKGSSLTKCSRLKVDAIFVAKESSASAVVFLEGGKFKWQQWGD